MLRGQLTVGIALGSGGWVGGDRRAAVVAVGVLLSVGWRAAVVGSGRSAAVVAVALAIGLGLGLGLRWTWSG